MVWYMVYGIRYTVYGIWYVPLKSNEQKNFGVLEVNDENSRIRILIRGSGSTPKCHGSATLPQSMSTSVKNKKTQRRPVL
jgi:hypothetical protein